MCVVVSVAPVYKPEMDCVDMKWALDLEILESNRK